MPQFRYRYIDSKGKKKTGLLEANGFDDAKEKLRAQKTLVLSLEENRNLKSKTLLRRKKGVLTGDQLIAFSNGLASLILAGMPLYESLGCLEEQYSAEPFHPTLLSLCEHIKKGSSLSAAMAKFPESFNTLYCAMVAAGESVGALEPTLRKLSILLTKQRKLKKQLTTAMIYPSILAGFSIFVCILLLTFVIPSLETLLKTALSTALLLLLWASAIF